MGATPCRVPDDCRDVRRGTGLDHRCHACPGARPSRLMVSSDTVQSATSIFQSGRTCARTAFNASSWSPVATIHRAVAGLPITSISVWTRTNVACVIPIICHPSPSIPRRVNPDKFQTDLLPRLPVWIALHQTVLLPSSRVASTFLMEHLELTAAVRLCLWRLEPILAEAPKH